MMVRWQKTVVQGQVGPLAEESGFRSLVEDTDAGLRNYPGRGERVGRRPAWKPVPWVVPATERLCVRGEQPGVVKTPWEGKVGLFSPGLAWHREAEKPFLTGTGKMLEVHKASLELEFNLL